jgi:hypothetical protein
LNTWNWKEQRKVKQLRCRFLNLRCSIQFHVFNTGWQQFSEIAVALRLPWCALALSLARNQRENRWKLLGLFFDLEDVGDIRVFLRNVGRLSQKYMALYPWIWNSP